MRKGKFGFDIRCEISVKIKTVHFTRAKSFVEQRNKVGDPLDENPFVFNRWFF